MNQTKQIKDAIRAKYAWPGGYPLYLVTSDGAALCCDCGRKEWKQIAYAIMHGLNDGWRVVAPDVNWEDPELYCDHCSQRIESAYAPEGAAIQPGTGGCYVKEGSVL